MKKPAFIYSIKDVKKKQCFSKEKARHPFFLGVENPFLSLCKSYKYRLSSRKANAPSCILREKLVYFFR